MKTARLIFVTIIIGIFFTTENGISSSTGIFQPVNKSELTSTQTKQFDLIEQRPYAVSLRMVRIPDIKQLYEKSILTVNLDFQASFTAIQTDEKEWEKGEYSWIGKPERDHETGEYVILDITSKGLTGIIWFNDILYSIFPLDKDIHVLYEVDQSKFPQEDADDCQCNESSGFTVPQHSDINLNPSSSQEQTKSSTITYDVLVAYTPAAENAAGNINGLINNAVNQANQVYGNSQATLRVNLVYKMLVNYTEVDMVTDLDSLVGNSNDDTEKKGT